MPHLQIDLATKHSFDVKPDLAKRLGNIYAELMQTTFTLVHVTFGESGEGNVSSCRSETPRPAAVLSLEIRAGRPPEQRDRLADAVLAALPEALRIDPTLAAAEMTQHSGDENYFAGYIDGVLRAALGVDWTPDEVGKPPRDVMIDRVHASAPA